MLKLRKTLLVVLVVFCASCTSTRSKFKSADRAFRDGEYERAADILKRGLEADKKKNGLDELLFLCDIGLALHTAGLFEESNKYLLQADRIAEIKDYTSLSAEAATLLATDNIKHYKGEDFEKVLINTYLAMNFAALGESDSALIEARKVNQKLYLMITEGKRKYKQNAFARYLSGVLYESQREFDDAYIDYKKVFDLKSNFPNLGRDLVRSAILAGRREDLPRWKEAFDLSDEVVKQIEKEVRNRELGEIVVFYENGISPVKRPHPNFRSVPKFYPRYNPVDFARVSINGVAKGQTEVLEDIENTAIRNLDEKWGGIVAKKVAGVVAKEAVGYGIGKATGSRALGALASFVMHAADQADVRSWNLLPRDLQLFRIKLLPGNYLLSATPEGKAPLPQKDVAVEKGKMTFVFFRYTPGLKRRLDRSFF